MNEEQKIWDMILENYCYNQDSLIEILLDIQKNCRQVSDDCIQYLSNKLNIAPTMLYSTVTFYNCFTKEKQGKYVISVCGGSGCHFGKKNDLLRCIRSELGLSSAKDTTNDGLFTLKMSDCCLGACGVGPIIKVNDRLYPHMDNEKAKALIQNIKYNGICETTLRPKDIGNY